VDTGSTLVTVVNMNTRDLHDRAASEGGLW
jgi:hypothetical protein